ncbi:MULTISPECIES: O-antigen ligase family protein [unclassified Spirosoma]|uniref:O-antigen ligase family protein n=1 Tax=unclassified Spirosoma TaxID=2621999 RepID=UPI00096A1A2B|nr:MULTISPECIES: O-antigen ligase family protein [unclassified Spirosoma]MBN8821479.1 O-antigen ligase family protein [Spirosoma sp.]OJW78259.1 MAG: O-antigen polymerase [Spirosoma sp. 48-14]
MAQSVFSLNSPTSGQVWLYSLLGGLYTVGVGYLISKMGPVGGVMALIAPIALLTVVMVFKEPKFGLFLYLQLSFLIGWSRFINVSIPIGLLIDGVLALTLLSLFINGQRMDWHRLRSPTFALIAIWFTYTLIELLNPEAPYRPAWFFHVRPFSMHWFMAGLAVLVLPITIRDIKILVYSWLGWSFLAAFWGFKQQYLGLEPAEQNWLSQGNNALTHVLFGQLRSFSFYSDAAQFGGEMAGATLVAVIYSFEEKKLIPKLICLALALTYFWGYAVSGTRSALFVMLAGFPFYLLLKRDFPKLIIGATLAVPLVLLLLYTSVGSSNYQVQRMRSALTPMNDPSFILRLQNQEKLKRYLAEYPFGAGIGTSTDMGARFSPWHWAAQTPPDSWYVELWIETGRVGLTIYLMMVVGLVLIGVYQVWQLKDPWLVKVMYAFLAEFVGIAVMGYSNPVMGQFPTDTMIFMTTILFTTCYRWDTPASESSPNPDSTLYSNPTPDTYETV